MENAVNRLHGETFLHLNNKEVDALLITLKQVNRIVAFTYQNLVLLVWKELSKFIIGDCCAAILEGRVE
jgi:hypothetical protein